MSGIIYKISSDKGPKVYYGSTVQTLATRFSHHRYSYQVSRACCSSSMLFSEYGIDNCIAETVEEVTIDLLPERERYWIDNDENCVNIRRPRVSEEEEKEYQKEWYEQNKDQIKEYKKEWYEQNKEKIKERSREWYERNKEKKKEYSRSYRLKMKASVEI